MTDLTANTIACLRRRLKAPDRMLQGDLALALGIVPVRSGSRRGSMEFYAQNIWFFDETEGHATRVTVAAWDSPALLTSIDAVDEVTRRLMPRWLPSSIGKDEFWMFRLRDPELACGSVGGVGETECLARLDALLAVLEMQADEA